MARTPMSSCFARAAWAALVLAGAASAARADLAPVDLVRGRSQADLAQRLARTRKEMVPEVEVKTATPSVKPKAVTDYALWGDYTLSLNLRTSGQNDPRELETTFTLPQVLTLYDANLFYNLDQNAYSFLETRNLNDQDSRARVFFRDPGVHKVDLSVEQSHFIDIPPQVRNRRNRERGEIEMSNMPLLPVRLAFDLNQVKGPGALGYRSWQSRDLRFEIAADALVADALITIPLRNFNDDTNVRNNTDAQGLQLAVGAGKNTAIRLQRWSLHNAASDEVEDLYVAEATTYSKDPYHIRGLESRSRFKIELHRDQVPRLARTKMNAETYSVTTYRRNRRLTFEMGGATRKVHRVKLDRRGIDLLALKPGASKGELQPFTQEDKPLVTEGWTSVSYRGIRRVNVNLKANAASIRRNPLTDFGNDVVLGQVSPGLYPKFRSGYTVDVTYNPYSPHWGAGVKLRTETREIEERGLEVDDTIGTLFGHWTPSAWITLNAEVSATTQNSQNGEIRTGQTDSQSYVFGLVYEATPHTQMFSDFTHVVSAGALAARDFLMTLGIDATEGDLDGATWRLMISREQLESDVVGVTPFAENQLIAQRRARF